MRYLSVLLVLLFALTVVSAQGAPEPINDAIANLGNQVGRPLTINDLENWSWSQSGYTAPCPAGTPVDAPGYQFVLTYGGQVYDYRVTADRSFVLLCSVTPLATPDAAPTAEPAIDAEPEYSNPLCPTPPAGIVYPRTRLTLNIQARVEPGLPNRLRQEPNINAAIITEIPAEAVFTITGGPNCDDAGRLWWQVDFDGTTGWTAERDSSDYFIEPVPGAALPVERGLISIENAADLAEVSRLEANFGANLVFAPTVEDRPSTILVVTGDSGTEAIWIYNTAALDIAPRLIEAPERITQVAFADDPAILTLGDADGGIRLWDIRPDAALLERVFLLGHDNEVSALAANNDGAAPRVASSGGMAFALEEDDLNLNAIVTWNIDTVSQEWILRGNLDAVNALTFGQPNVLASGAADGRVTVWELTTPANAVLRESGPAVNDLAYTADFTTLVLAQADGTVEFINAVNGESLQTIPAHNSVLALDVLGSLLVTAGADGLIRVWDIDNPAQPLAELVGHEGGIVDVAFSPDGTFVASLGEDHSLRVWAVR